MIRNSKLDSLTAVPEEPMLIPENLKGELDQVVTFFLGIPPEHLRESLQVFRESLIKAYTDRAEGIEKDICRMSDLKALYYNEIKTLKHDSNS